MVAAIKSESVAAFVGIRNEMARLAWDTMTCVTADRHQLVDAEIVC